MGLPDDPASRVRAILERVVEELDVEASVEVDEADEEIVGRIEGEDVGLVIGRRGQTIDAVQLLCYRAAFRGRQDRKRVVIDATERLYQRAPLGQRAGPAAPGSRCFQPHCRDGSAPPSAPAHQCARQMPP